MIYWINLNINRIFWIKLYPHLDSAYRNFLRYASNIFLFAMWQAILFRWTTMFCRNKNGWVEQDQDTDGYEAVQGMWSVRSADEKCKIFSLLLWIRLATWLATCTYFVSQLCYSFSVVFPTFIRKKAESRTIKLVLTLFTATLIFEVESSSKSR